MRFFLEMLTICFWYAEVRLRREFSFIIGDGVAPLTCSSSAGPSINAGDDGSFRSAGTPATTAPAPDPWCFTARRSPSVLMALHCSLAGASSRVTNWYQFR